MFISDPDLDLAHELLGHGLQAAGKNLRTVEWLDDEHDDDFVQSKNGKLSIYENDAQAIQNRVASATGRRNMIESTYKTDRTAKKYLPNASPINQVFIYQIDPKRLIQWNRNGQY